MSTQPSPAPLNLSEQTAVVDIWLVTDFGQVIHTVRDLLGDRRDEIEISIVSTCEHPEHATEMAASLQGRLDAIRDAVDDAPDNPNHDLDIISARLLSRLVPSAVHLCTDLHPVVLANVAIGAQILDSGYPMFDFRYGRRPVAVIFPTPPERDLRALLGSDPENLLANLTVAAGRMADDPLTSGLIVVPHM